MFSLGPGGWGVGHNKIGRAKININNTAVGSPTDILVDPSVLILSTKFSRILLNLVLKISTLGSTSISVGLPTAVLLILIFARPILL